MSTADTFLGIVFAVFFCVNHLHNNYGVGNNFDRYLRYLHFRLNHIFCAEFCSSGTFQ